MRCARRLLVGLVAAACTTAPVGGLAGADPRSAGGDIGGSLAEDIVRVGGFARVAAVAVSRTRVFVVADGGIALYDRLASRWLVPLPLPLDLTRTATTTLAAADPTSDALWVALGPRLWVVRPATHYFTSVQLSSDARELLVDKLGRGVYVYSNGWWLVSSTGSMSPLPGGQGPSRDDVVANPDAQQILRDTPGLQAFGALLTRDEQLRTWQLSALARAPERNDVWAGTNGGGVFDVDPAFLRSTQMPFGLRTRGAAAVALAADGAWIAEEPDASVSSDFGLTFASEDLASWRWLSPVRGPLGVVSMSVRGHDACLATNAGTLIIDLSAKRFGEPRVYELAQVGRQLAAWSTTDGCWIGGTSGIARLPWTADSAAAPTMIADGRAAYAFASSGDTVWAATQAGVQRFVDGHPAARATSGIGDGAPAPLPNALAGAIRGLALAGDGLALLTDRELWLTTGEGRLGAAQRVEAPIDRLGRIRRIVADDRTVWLGGSRGAAALSLRDRRLRFVELADPSLSFGLHASDPADVRDLALSPRVAWLATAAGIVRIARGDDGMPR